MKLAVIIIAGFFGLIAMNGALKPAYDQSVRDLKAQGKIQGKVDLRCISRHRRPESWQAMVDCSY